MEFEKFLTVKKINPSAFKQEDAQQFLAFKTLFYQVHPASFVQQKLFLINKIRRKYPLNTEKVEIRTPKNTKITL